MSKDSIEQALSVLESKEADLTPEQRGRLAKLLKAGEGIRKDVTDTFEAKGNKPADTAESEKQNPGLAAYKQDYDRMNGNVRKRLLWEKIAERLLANDSEKLKLAQAMQGGGQLVGIDAEGKALFKDKGVEPVMYGFDKENKPMRIYDRNLEEISKVTRWAGYYFEIRRQVHKDGYELFPYKGDYDFSDEMRQAQSHTGEPFVASKNRREWRGSWLESDDKLAYMRVASFGPKDGDVRVFGNLPGYRYNDYGVVRLLRI